MGQEASVPRGEEPPTDNTAGGSHQAPPQGGRAVGGNEIIGGEPNPGAANLSENGGGLGSDNASNNQQPQQSTMTGAARAGISSMIQRMGGTSSQTSKRFAARTKGPTHNTNNAAPPGESSSNSNNTGNHPLHYNSDNVVHHQDLSPMSKARQQAMQQQKMQQQQQQTQHVLVSNEGGATSPPPNTFVNVMYTNRSSSDKTVHTANTSSGQTAARALGGMTDNTHTTGQNSAASASLLTVEMSNMEINGRGSETKKAPSSPRALSLKNMQNNDEEDWEKAWAEDSESDDEDEDGHVQHQHVGGEMPVVPSLESTAAGHTASLAFRPDMDSGHSSTSVQIAGMGGVSSTSAQQQQALHNGIPPSAPPGSYPYSTPPYGMQQQLLHSQPLTAEEDARLMQEANHALQGGWDSYALDIGEGEKEAEKPCVGMFDPALRVLGRGSFGRVSDE